MVKIDRKQLKRFYANPFLGLALLACTVFAFPSYAQVNSVPTIEQEEMSAPQSLSAEGQMEPMTAPEVTEVSLSDEMETENIFEQQEALFEGQDNLYYEDLVLAVFANKKRLSTGIFAIQQNDRYYLPVLALSRILDFNIEYDRASGYAEGWSLSQEQSFSIDAAGRTVSYQGRSTSVPSEAFISTDVPNDDFYVLLEVLNEVWPLDLEVVLSSLVLKIIPDDKLPFEQALERKQRQEKLRQRQERNENEKITGLPFIARPYQLYSKPIIDISANAGYDARLDNPEFRTTINGVNDLGYASADYSASFAQVNGQFDKPENIRLRFRRQNIHDGALPFGLEDVRWGDVNLRNRELIASGLSGRGATFTTREDNFANEFDRITIEGIGTPGFETELYLNDQLIDFGVVDGTGIYRYEDVVIGYGNNRVRVVLYGPQGQITERVENYFYQGNMLKPGKNEFSGGVVDSEKDLIPIDERDSARPKGLAANLYAARGISEKLTLFGTANTVRDREANSNRNEISREYVSVGAIGSLGTNLAQVEAYKELSGGSALDVRTISDFKGFKINTQTSLFDNFESPDAQRGDNAKEVEFDFNIKKIFKTALGSLGLEFGTDYLKRKNDIATTGYTTRQSLALPGTRLTHQTRTLLSNGDHSSTTGRLSSTTRLDKYRWRNSLGYRTFPEQKLSNYQTELRYRYNKDLEGAVRFQQNFDSDETIVGAQITRDFKKFLGSFETDWSSKFGTSFMLRASASLGPYGPDGKYLTSSETLRTVGPVSSFVYMDNDYDGEFGEGDEPVPNTKMVVGRRTTKEETDELGYLTEINPSARGRTNVYVDSGSIDDPYLMPGVDGYQIFTRPGVMHDLEFPLIQTGAIDGTLRWQHSGEPIAGLNLQLMDGEGDIIQSSQTAADGYYTFERIVPDDYTIRADPESGFNIPFKTVNLTKGNLFQFGVDIDAVDLNQTYADANTNDDFGMEVADDGMMNISNIVSIAKGYKDKNGRRVAPSQKMAQPAVQTNTQTQPMVKAQPAMQTSAASDVQSVRIGNHPDKSRIVLDLSGPTVFTISYDSVGNMIFVDMPYATWGGQRQYAGKAGSVINSYNVENIDRGVRMVISVNEGISVGASGLLKAAAGKKDRLYIDVEKN